jgi:A/G-specific adenine glycosylase
MAKHSTQAHPETDAEMGLKFSPAEFRRHLGAWYRENARDLPWRGVHDPYATWLSEIMLQQTRVATVIERYQEFLRRFPTLADLAAAQEADVLALWSGLGYYRRARMLHRGAQFVVHELGGRLPGTAAELRTLPGIGDYTAAAIASIAFGESIAVLDGNVERVLLRLLGQAENKSAKARARLMRVAQRLIPPAQRLIPPAQRLIPSPQRPTPRTPPQGSHVAAAHTYTPADHNQAMMELGATICLPRSPLCMQCPVLDMCATRGEHLTPERARMQSRTVAHLLALRKRGAETEVLLERRPVDASLMAGMLELPALPLEATQALEPVLRLRHSITNTNYYVGIFAESGVLGASAAQRSPGAASTSLQDQIPAAPSNLEWVETGKLALVPLTGLTRKALQRLAVMEIPRVTLG